ncbi:MAG: cell division protein FtsZ [Bacteroidetes bacterium]|nr:cell division protein FtsZ [Bacteroidota bacterium]
MDNFASQFTFDDAPTQGAKIAVVGVGGGGGNAVNNMIEKGIQGVSFLVINTDNQALANSGAQTRIQAGRNLTSGLGAGARPQIGAEAVEESRTDIEQALQGLDMVFITAGMGGGTGTGGAPVVAQIARKLNILTVGVVTKPFVCEGTKRLSAAHQGIALLKQQVDTIIVIPNESLLEAYPDASLIEAFGKVDDVLYEATRGISDLITTHGLVNLDFADVKTTIKDGGLALMGSATATGENRAEKAALAAISSPLLDGISISGARNVLVNITAGRNLGVREATQATQAIHHKAGDDVEVILGTVIDDALGDEMRVTVIATGFDRSPDMPVISQGPPRIAEQFAQSAASPATVSATPSVAVAPESPVAPPTAHVVLTTPVAIPQAPATAPVKPGNYTRRTEPLGDVRYLAEENIAFLDTPAYTRRTPSGPGVSLSAPDAEYRRVDAAEPTEPPSRLRRSLDEVDRTTPGRSVEEPAFMRKIMD